MTGEELLKALVAVATGEAPTDQMSAHLVRFVLEYNQPTNIAAEREKIIALLRTKSFSFDAMESDVNVALARFAVLQFAGVVRVFSDRALYEMATALKDRLHLVSCEPDVGARVYAEPDARDFEEMLPEPSRPRAAILACAQSQAEVVIPDSGFLLVQQLRPCRSLQYGGSNAENARCLPEIIPPYRCGVKYSLPCALRGTR